MAQVKCTPERVLSVATAEVGYLEKKSNSQLDDKTANAGSKNYTKYARDLNDYPGLLNGNKQGFAWCAVFVIWLFIKAFGVDVAKILLCLPENSLAASCTYLSNYFKQKGLFYKSNPKPGDLIFFKDSSGGVGHVGIVYKVDNLYVYTIEGNTSSQAGVVANGGGVFKKSYALSYNRIYGYGRPDYDNVYYEVPDEEVKPEPEKAETVQTVKAKDGARYFLKTLTGSYKVTASALNVRHGAGITKATMVTIPRDTKVNCYGYYSIALGVKWYYVAFTYKGVSYQGFCHSGYLKKC